MRKGHYSCSGWFDVILSGMERTVAKAGVGAFVQLRLKAELNVDIASWIGQSAEKYIVLDFRFFT